MDHQLPSPSSITKERARQLRQSHVPAEQLVWSILRNRRLAGLKFRRQVPIGPYIADFYCYDARLVVELDGETHDFRKQQDAERSRYLASHHLDVFRVRNEDVFGDLESVAHAIMRAAGIDVAQWLVKQAKRVNEHKPPHPNPLPQGEGTGSGNE